MSIKSHGVDCSGHVAAALGGANPVYGRNFKIPLGVTPKSLFHYCEHCGEPVRSVGSSRWFHTNPAAACTQFSTNPVVSLIKARALTPALDREAEWAQERAELLTELDVAAAGRQRLVTELRELYERVCIHNCSSGFILSRDRIDEIEDLVATYS